MPLTSLLLAISLAHAASAAYVLNEHDFTALKASKSAIAGQKDVDALKAKDPAAHRRLLETRNAWWDWVADTSAEPAEVLRLDSPYLSPYEIQVSLRAEARKTARAIAPVIQEAGKDPKKMKALREGLREAGKPAPKQH